jgi:small-conductance mechanosensitive channel
MSNPASPCWAAGESSLWALKLAQLPGWMNETTFLGMNAAEWGGLAAFIGIAYLAGILLQWLILTVAKMITTRTRAKWDDDFIALLQGPLWMFLALFILSQMLLWLELEAGIYDFIHSLISCALAGALVWFLLKFLQFGTRMTELYFNRGIEGTSQARAIHTQIVVVRGILRFLLIVVGAALMLMQFEVARNLGVSLLASAGIATAAIGFASQKTIATMFAGIQIAFTQTIRIDDVVIVEGNWGRIEEIRLTYVVVRIWDLRRLIVPVTYFTDNSFENWTAKSPELLGTVFLYTDYSVPVNEIRDELKRILENEGKNLWDGKVSGVVVTNVTAQNIEVRILVSGADSGKLWELRCLVREKMLDWLRTRGKNYLARQRVQPEGPFSGDGKDAGASFLLIPGSGEEVK